MSLIAWLKNRLFCELAIDLGTTNTLVYLKGKGIIVQEPSVVVINRETGKVEAVGKRAKEMLGKTPDSVLVIKPMRDGVIADFEVAEKMLDFFIRKSKRNRSFFVRPRIVIGIPTGITQVEKRAVKDVVIRTKASEVYLIGFSRCRSRSSYFRANRHNDCGHRRRNNRYRCHFSQWDRISPFHTNCWE